jgi:rRNA biogenesis protein RRP5
MPSFSVANDSDFQISRLSDEHMEKVDSKKYKLGATIRARIVGLDTMDGLVICSCQPSILERPFLRVTDVKVGEILKGQVLRLERFGALVTLSEGIRALCPTEHLSDVALTKPEIKFKEGLQVKMRVLNVDAKERHVLVTFKKSLLSADVRVVDKYDPGFVGTVTVGTVRAAGDFGVIVEFFNRVQGLVPVREIRYAGGSGFGLRPTEAWQIYVVFTVCPSISPL